MGRVRSIWTSSRTEIFDINGLVRLSNPSSFPIRGWASDYLYCNRFAMSNPNFGFPAMGSPPICWRIWAVCNV